MRWFTRFWVLALWAGLSAAPVRAGQPEEDEATLKEAKLQTDTPALVEFFRKRVLPENDHMLRVCKLLGFRLRYSMEERVIKAELLLSETTRP